MNGIAADRQSALAVVLQPRDGGEELGRLMAVGIDSLNENRSPVGQREDDAPVGGFTAPVQSARAVTQSKSGSSTDMR